MLKQAADGARRPLEDAKTRLQRQLNAYAEEQTRAAEAERRRIEAEQPQIKIESIHDLPVDIKKIDIGNDAKAKITLEVNIGSDEVFLAMRGMLSMQRAGRVLISLEPTQADLFD
jgi:hypothetical protein